jgi:hypothetical protein
MNADEQHPGAIHQQPQIRASLQEMQPKGEREDRQQRRRPDGHRPGDEKRHGRQGLDTPQDLGVQAIGTFSDPGLLVAGGFAALRTTGTARLSRSNWICLPVLSAASITGTCHSHGVAVNTRSSCSSPHMRSKSRSPFV